MTGTKDHKYLARLFAVLFILCAAFSVSNLRAEGQYWERIPIQHTLPSHIFSALGLTHTTRNGYTRGVPHGRDENFPPGLTDIIPYDTMSLLIVRGTVEAVAVFRQRVQALDVVQPTWTVQFRLIDPATQTVLGVLLKTNVLMDDSELANISDGTANHAYRFHLYLAARGQIAVVLRTGVDAPATGGLPVFAPSVVWLNPVSKTTSFQTPVVFNDLASDRASVHNGLGATADKDSNYAVEITVTPNAASGLVAVPAVPAGADHVAAPANPPATVLVDPPAATNGTQIAPAK